MKASQAGKEKEDTFVSLRPCVICRKQCAPYGYTQDWGHLCSRQCSDTYDKEKLQWKPSVVSGVVKPS